MFGLGPSLPTRGSPPEGGYLPASSCATERGAGVCARSLFICHNQIKPCTFPRYRTLHLKGSQSESLTEWTRWGIRSRAKPSNQQLGTPVPGSWLVWTRSCPGWSSSLHGTNSAEGYQCRGMAVLLGHLRPSDGVCRAAPPARGTDATLRLRHRCRAEVAAPIETHGKSDEKNFHEIHWELYQGFPESCSLLLILHHFLTQVLSFLWSLIKALISLNDEKLSRHQHIKHAEATILLLSKRARLAFACVRAPCRVKRKNHVLHQHFTVKFKLSVPPGKSWCNTQTVPVNWSLVNV